MSDIDGAAVLAVPMEENDAGATTIREYLVALARQVWTDGADFAGKRPFGNSDWTWDVYAALGRAGLMDANFDDEGWFVGDMLKGDELIAAACTALGGESAPLPVYRYQPAMVQRQPLYQHACGQVQPYEGEDDGDVMECDGCALPDPWQPLYVLAAPA